MIIDFVDQFRTLEGILKLKSENLEETELEKNDLKEELENLRQKVEKSQQLLEEANQNAEINNLEQISKLQEKIEDLEQMIININKEKYDLSGQLDISSADVIKSSEEYNNKIAELESSNAILLQTLKQKEDDLNDLHNTINELRAKLSHLQEDNMSLTHKNKELNHELDESKILLNSTSRSSDEIVTKLRDNHINELEKYSNEIEELKMKVNSQQDEIVKLHEDNHHKANEIETAKFTINEISQLKDGFACKVYELEPVKNQLHDLMKSFDLLKEENQSIKEENHSENHPLNKENKSIKEENHSLNKENQTIKEENQTIKEENQTIKVENQTIKAENQTIKEENQTIKEEIESLKQDIMNNEHIISEQNGRINDLEVVANNEEQSKDIEDQLNVDDVIALMKDETNINDCFIEILMEIKNEKIDSSINDIIVFVFKRFAEMINKLILNDEEKDQTILNLTRNIDELSEQNQKLDELVTVLEKDKTTVQDFYLVKSLFEKKSKRVEELNAELNEKNNLIESLKKAKSSDLNGNQDDKINRKEELIILRVILFKNFFY